MLDFIHNVHETVRHFWWAFFLGWWALCLILAIVRPKDREVFLGIAAIFTAVGLLVSSVSLATVYAGGQWAEPDCGANDGGHTSRDEIGDCEGSAAASQEHFMSLAVYKDADDSSQPRPIAFWATWWNVFGDTVSYVQIVELWLAIPAFVIWLFARKRTPPATKRDIIRIK